MVIQRNKGFTLVELSIVLVIIGLLIGGILVGQSMVLTAKVQSFIRQLNQVETAVNSFRAKYNSIPGDTDKLDNPGNADGIIVSSSCVAASGGMCFADEVTNFWVHLNISGYDPDHTYSSTITDNFSQKDISPLNGPKIGDNTTLIASAVIDSSGNILTKNWYLAADLSSIDGSNAGTVCAAINSTFTSGNCEYGPPSITKAAFTPKNALAIDSKIDDGLYNAGKIRGNYPADLSTANCYADISRDPACILFILSDNLN